jgi:hypothetical protein
MRPASCGFENPDGMTFLQFSPPVSTASPLLARAQMPNGFIPRHLAAKLLTSPSLPDGQREQDTADPDVLEERG